MRTLGPLKDAEYVLPDGEVIITHTDPSSRITYANTAFLTSSGYTLEECLGQPQNIVRHPDMPKEAFADLWRTIRAGKSWTGLVKNRRKNGGFYWVRANVTPMVDSQRGEIVGYMSVRVKPTLAEIQQAEQVYAAIRGGRAGSLCIREGRVFDASWLGGLKRALNPSLRIGTWAVIGFLSALLLAMGAISAATVGAGWMTYLSFLGAAIALANMFYIQSNVVRPLIRLQRATFDLLSGDTRTRIPTAGVSCIVSVAGTLEQVRVKLDGVLKDNMAAASRVQSGVVQVVDSNADLSNRTGEHAASLQETAASLEELTATVTRNRDNAHEAVSLATKSFDVTTRGRDVVGQLFSTMSEISGSSTRIGEIVGIIDGIAFQTNLLALNAAVEAARAGDQGRGFAVVAQEVRSLAQRSAAAAKEVKTLIQASEQTVTRGSELASQAERAMTQVVDSVQQVTGVIQEIEAATREQAEGIDQINKAVTQMDNITQQDAHMAQQLSETARSLQDESTQMLAAISAFSMQQEQGGASAATRRTPAHRPTHAVERIQTRRVA
ncbi:methyl-accepting chemotaxis protein [Peristeroidobacter soli]|jgi:aerotaxis receptor|uniref:methyl-accepting chemotaxis protein n=1 Tax=Peristeroidobacter soli TaxID=2497877 RepID=UPI00101D07C9|nr:methyl-accepting chemotaxis protein [Peristeroidobacter soli]